MRSVANGVGIEFDVTGSGTPVVLLHGFPDSGRLWRNQVPALAEAGFQVIVPDLRGAGRSDKPAEVEAYRMPVLAMDVLGILDTVGAERAHLVGHDWGAALAWVVASIAPDRVDHLAVLSVGHHTAFRTAGRRQWEKSWYMLLFQFAGVAEEWLSADDWAMAREWSGHPDADAVLAEIEASRSLTPGLNWYRANAAPRSWIKPAPVLPPIQAPTMGIWSSGDFALTEEQMTGSAGYVAGPWRYERLEGPGHWLQLEAPREVNRLLLDFLPGPSALHALMNEHYDVVVVGGRVAGATLAANVARRGMGVCVVERADFPSDTLSTHVFQYLEGFERLGVMEKLLATGAPPLTEFRLRVDGVDLAQDHPDLAMLNIRRRVLDPILLDNAAAAGADVALRTRVVGLLHDERRVTGVRIEDPEGRPSEIRARVVIGADGRNSTVARLVRARRYNVTENERAGGVAYYEGVEPHGVFHLSILGSTYFIGSSCDNGLFMASAYYDKADHRRFREPNGFEEGLATCPAFASMLKGATMTGPPLFASRWQGFFREPAGPGWALVGDAGHFKDPAPGQGIADAVRQTERLAEYVCYGIDTHSLGDQLARWGRWRDHDAAEMYWWAREYGRAGPQSPVVVEMFRRLATNPRTLRAAHTVAFHQARPFRVFSPVRASAAAARLLARGGTPRGEVLADLVTLGARDFQRRWRTHRPIYEEGPGRDAQEEPEQVLQHGVET